MGFRFRRRIKVLAGLWFNVLSPGASASVGTKGLTVKFEGGETRTTISAPCTGIRYSTASNRSADRSSRAPKTGGRSM